ncbi:MAG: sialate O-acetylesterase [Pontiellaceae bacterium]|nr:sialate O-acetylesterase [Pontiellaceae bacterium]MBN2786246.1 sialate O-acetylesterase [Pontiellaceae bacterium]
MKNRLSKAAKRIFILGIVGLLAVPAPAQESAPDKYTGPKDKLQVYLLIGQSNMAGRAPFAEEQAGPVEGAYLFTDKAEWEPARNPLNRYSTIRKDLGMQKMNPGYAFAIEMRKHNPDRAIGLVVNARGGTGIGEWKRGTPYYKEALRRAKEAQKSGTLCGILWHQGEGDSEHPEAYLSNLQQLVSDLRKDLKMPRLPFVAGQINGVPAINDQIAKLPETVPFSGVAGSEDLKAMDRWHFDTESMLLLGRRYAEAMLKLQKKP